MAMVQFFLAMVPPTATHQEKQVRVIKGKPVVYEPAALKAARAKLMGRLDKYKPVEPLEGALRWYASGASRWTRADGTGMESTRHPSRTRITCRSCSRTA